MATELAPHGREQLAREGTQVARLEPLVEGGGDDTRRYALLDRGLGRYVDTMQHKIDGVKNPGKPFAPCLVKPVGKILKSLKASVFS